MSNKIEKTRFYYCGYERLFILGQASPEYAKECDAAIKAGWVFEKAKVEELLRLPPNGKPYEYTQLGRTLCQYRRLVT